MNSPLRLVPLAASCCAALLGLLAGSSQAVAMPAFARQYNVNCQMCHSAFPRLNEFGEHFAGENMRLPNWRDTMMDTGDDRLALPKSLPLAIRAQAFGRGATARKWTTRPARRATTRRSTCRRPTW